MLSALDRMDKALERLANEAERTAHLLAILSTVVEQMPGLILCDLAARTILAASTDFWEALGRPVARGVDYLPIIAVRDRDAAAAASDARPLGVPGAAPYHVRYLHADGHEVATVWRPGVVPQAGAPVSVGLFRIEVSG